MATACSEEIQPFLDDFLSDADSLSFDRDSPVEVERFRLILMVGISIALSIDRVDTNWHKAIFDGSDGYDPAQEKWILDCYKTWLDGAHKVAAYLDHLEGNGQEVKWSGQFRRAYREVKALLTPDDQYFDGDVLIEMRDAAIESHRGGRTVEFHELGN